MYISRSWYRAVDTFLPSSQEIAGAGEENSAEIPGTEKKVEVLKLV
ncbi:hypothetical protein [Methanosarcina barkeri]|nr:hypothetical protein [Methanosarcina barkeri]